MELVAVNGTSPVVPVISEPTIAGMTWPEAMQAVMDGKHITRLEWKSTEQIFLHRGRLTLQSKSGTLHDLIVCDGDMYATDWVVINS